MSLADWGYSPQDFGYEPDDDDGPRQPRCTRCGRFMPMKPNSNGTVKVGQDDHMGYDDEGNETTFTLIAEYWQPVMGWECACRNFQGGFDSGPEFKQVYDPPIVGDWRPVEGKPGTSQVIWRPRNDAR